jgi:hypothetical protein
MNYKSTLEVFNTLNDIHRDRQHVYEQAADLTSELDLKSLFFLFAQYSRLSRMELIAELKHFADESAVSTKQNSKVYYDRIRIKLAISDRNREVLLLNCERGETRALRSLKYIFFKNSSQIIWAHRDFFRRNIENLEYEREKLVEHMDLIEVPAA